MNEETTIFQQIKFLIDDLEQDASIKGSREWDLVSDRYDENLQELKDLVDML
jgi:hypothetical protein